MPEGKGTSKQQNKLSLLAGMAAEEITAAAVRLRAMCAKPRCYAAENIRDFLEQQEGLFGEGAARRIINTGNLNMKTAFHHACQLRSEPDVSPSLVFQERDTIPSVVSCVREKKVQGSVSRGSKWSCVDHRECLHKSEFFNVIARLQICLRTQQSLCL